jgi:hypothetical protein
MIPDSNRFYLFSLRLDFTEKCAHILHRRTFRGLFGGCFRLCGDYPSYGLVKHVGQNDVVLCSLFKLKDSLDFCDRRLAWKRYRSIFQLTLNYPQLHNGVIAFAHLYKGRDGCFADICMLDTNAGTLIKLSNGHRRCVSGALGLSLVTFRLTMLRIGSTIDYILCRKTLGL